jgi:hypothetical protein
MFIEPTWSAVAVGVALILAGLLLVWALHLRGTTARRGLRARRTYVSFLPITIGLQVVVTQLPLVLGGPNALVSVGNVAGQVLGLTSLAIVMHSVVVLLRAIRGIVFPRRRVVRTPRPEA